MGRRDTAHSQKRAPGSQVSSHTIGDGNGNRSGLRSGLRSWDADIVEGPGLQLRGHCRSPWLGTSGWLNKLVEGCFGRRVHPVVEMACCQPRCCYSGVPWSAASGHRIYKCADAALGALVFRKARCPSSKLFKHVLVPLCWR